MQLSSIVTLLALVTSVVSRVSSRSRASSILSGRDAASLGCVDPSGDDQHIEFHSGANIFSMRVPMDNNNYNIGKPAAQMKCISLTTAGNPCVACWDRMDHVEMTLPGSCSFMLTDNSGKLFTMQADNTQGLVALSRPGYLALVTCNPPQHPAIRTIGETQYTCEEFENLQITLFIGAQHYVLSVPPTEDIFEVVGPDSTLGCNGPLHQEHPMCQACDFPVQSLTIQPEAGACAFNLSGYPDKLYYTHPDGSLTLPNPTQILSVSCGLNLASENHGMLSILSDQDLEQRSPKSGCLGTETGVVFNTTIPGKLFNQTYMAVPANQQYYSVSGQNPELECYFFWEPIAIPCHSCYNYEMTSLRPSEGTGGCRFKIEGWNTLLETYEGDPTPWTFDSPVKVLGVQCGFQGFSNGLAISNVRQENANIDIEHSVRSSRDVDPVPLAEQCGRSGWPLSILASDGSVYCPSISLDYEFHPMADMTCLRPSDLAFIPCNQIGPAVVIGSIDGYGPCIFFTEDHRSFITKYMATPGVSYTAAFQEITPGNAISGIECGSA